MTQADDGRGDLSRGGRRYFCIQPNWVTHTHTHADERQSNKSKAAEKEACMGDGGSAGVKPERHNNHRQGSCGGNLPFTPSLFSTSIHMEANERLHPPPTSSYHSKLRGTETMWTTRAREGSKGEEETISAAAG